MRFILSLTTLFTLLVSANAQLNMEFLSRVSYQDGVNDCWGYVAPDSTEYALVGIHGGVSIVSLADPANAEELFFIPGARSTWRDMKTFGTYAYVTNESAEGVMVIDLSMLPDSVSHTNYEVPLPNGGGNITRCHNLYIDSLGRIYLTGCNGNNGGIVILDATANATEPPVIALGPPVYSHDIFALGDYMYTSEIYAGEMGIYDISDLDSIREVSKRETPFRFTHNAWTTQDGNYVFTTDERANAYVAAYDISNKEDIVFLDQHRPLATEGKGVIPHNVHVTKDNFLVTSHYTDGVIVVDANRPSNLIEVGNYDTFGGPDGGFSGCWGAYPFLPSGIVLASDRQTGLYVLGVEYVRACYLEGQVTDYITGQPIFGASIMILSGELNQTTADLEGEYQTGQVSSGTFEVEFSAANYLPQTLTVTLENGQVTIQDVRLVPVTGLVEKMGVVYAALDSTPIEGAHIRRSNDDFQYAAFSDTAGRYSMDDVVWADYTGAAGAWGYAEQVLDTVTVNSEENWPDIFMKKGYEDGFLLDQGWTTSSSAQRGAWVRSVPIGQQKGSGQTAPDADVDSDLGTMCYVTGNGAVSADLDGVAGGSVRLTSPPIDLSAYNDAYLKWYEWLHLEDAPNAIMILGLNQRGIDIPLSLSIQNTQGWAENGIPYDNLQLIPGFDPDTVFHLYLQLDNPDSTGIAEAGLDHFTVTDQRFSRSFSFDSTVTCAGSTLRFYDLNNHTISWNWTIRFDSIEYFSNEKNPEILFEYPGVYDVSLEAISCFGDTLIFTQPLLIDVLDVPVAEFSFLPPSPVCSSLQFFNESDFGQQYRWGFGDGTSSDERDPFHEYEEDGIYEVVLITDNICGSDTSIMEVEVITPPVADFFSPGAPSEVCIGDTILFSNLSSANSTSWSWEFEGGTPASSQEKDPAVVYQVPGVYDVRLIVENQCGKDTIVKAGTFEVVDVPVPSFDYTVTGREVNFTNNSSGTSLYTWDFGDGQRSILSDPVHIYAADGTYAVSLTAFNACDTVTVTDSVVIRTTALEQFVEGPVKVGPNPFEASFFIHFDAKRPVDVELTDLFGRSLQRIPVESGEFRREITTEVPSGVYLLVIRDRSGAVLWTKRLARG